jgi:hypothetical protein
MPSEDGFVFLPYARQKPILIDDTMANADGIPYFSIIEYDDSIVCHSKLMPFVMFCESQKTGDMSFAKVSVDEIDFSKSTKIDLKDIVK